MTWVSAVEQLRRERRPGVLVTLAAVRGHAPREAGAKLVVAAEETWGSIGGGNLEATAVTRAVGMLADAAAGPELFTLALSERAPNDHGVQCCGGEVTILLEPLAVVPAVAIFGLGHVGLELARILARHNLDLHLVDSRVDRVAENALAGATAQALAHIETHHAPVPELILGQVPAGAHVLVMTHDHAEDVALCDMALRCTHLGSVRLIGSSAKWARFRRRLLAEGHEEQAVDRIITPIGLPDIAAKDPATVALSVAADLVRTFERDRAMATGVDP